MLRVPPGHLLLQTVRSHDQYNTTIYGLDDRYRGVSGRATASWAVRCCTLRRAVTLPIYVRSSLMTMAFDTGVLDLAAVWSSGTREFVSG